MAQRSPSTGTPEPISDLGKPPEVRPKRIFVALPSWVGDTAMCTPALRALRTAFPETAIVAEGKRHLGDLLLGLDSVNEFRALPPKGFASTIRHARSLRRERFDWAVLLGESERVAAAPFLARIPVRVGFGRGGLRKKLLTHYLERPRDPDGKLAAFSMIERYLRVTRSLGIADAGDHMDLVVQESARKAISARLEAQGIGREEPVLTIISGAAFGAAKTWLPEYFAQAADQLFESKGLRAVLAPGPGEERIGTEVAAHSKHGVAVLVDPPLAIRETAALLERSEMALSNDTGPRSMAVALGLPVVVPIGPTEDGHTRHHLERQRVLIEDVDCRPCRLRICPIDHRCMTRITPDRVVSAALELMQTVGTGPQRLDP